MNKLYSVSRSLCNNWIRHAKIHRKERIIFNSHPSLVSIWYVFRIKYCIILRHVSVRTKDIYFSDVQHTFLAFLITNNIVYYNTNYASSNALSFRKLHAKTASIILNICSCNKRKSKINHLLLMKKMANLTSLFIISINLITKRQIKLEEWKFIKYTWI